MKNHIICAVRNKDCRMTEFRERKLITHEKGSNSMTPASSKSFVRFLKGGRVEGQSPCRCICNDEQSSYMKFLAVNASQFGMIFHPLSFYIYYIHMSLTILTKNYYIIKTKSIKKVIA